MLDVLGFYDFNVWFKNSSGLSFSWYCKRVDDDIMKEGCYGYYLGKLSSNKFFIEVDVDSMDEN